MSAIRAVSVIDKFECHKTWCPCIVVISNMCILREEVYNVLLGDGFCICY